MESVWTKTAKRPDFESLDQDITTDVLVIGGGMTGILCGYLLKEAGVSCVIVEADKICSGTTGNTTGKLTVQHGLIYHKLIRSFGVEAAKRYLDANREALAKYQSLCRSIDCDFEKRDSYVYALHDRQKLEKELKALERIGCRASFVEDLPLPFPVAGAVKIAQQAEFHPLKFAFAAARELSIYENTMVTELCPNGARTKEHQITAKTVIVATHFPFVNTHGSYFLKLYQHRSYLIGLENGPDLNGMYVDEDQKGYTFRNYGDLLLVGGGGHRTGKKGGGPQVPETLAARCYPDAKIVYRWAAQDCMPLDDLPYIGRYSAMTPDLYVATGFRKWGMTGAMTAAMLLTDLILDRESPYVGLFSPSRSILRRQLAVNALESAVNLATPTLPRCPHMGCALKYNPAEETWDCPCHGSRFTKDGRLIDNPALHDMKTPAQ